VRRSVGDIRGPLCHVWRPAERRSVGITSVQSTRACSAHHGYSRVLTGTHGYSHGTRHHTRAVHQGLLRAPLREALLTLTVRLVRVVGTLIHSTESKRTAATASDGWRRSGPIPFHRLCAARTARPHGAHHLVRKRRVREQVGDDRFVLDRIHRARGVDQPPSRLQQLRSATVRAAAGRYAAQETNETSSRRTTRDRTGTRGHTTAFAPMLRCRHLLAALRRSATEDWARPCVQCRLTGE
jgi:hypothetical protein